MDPFLIIAIVIGALALLGIVLFAVALLLKRKGSKTKESKEEAMAIAFKEIPALEKEDEARLVEIKDSEIIKRINQSIPGAVKTAANFTTSSALHLASGTGTTLYQAVIPAGAVLDQSKKLEGAVRATYRLADGTIAGQANLVAVGADKLKAATALSAASGIMSVASLVVGQYFMSQINGNLKDMNARLEKLSSWSNNEFKSKVMALIAEVQKTSVFEVEIIENHELRTRELTHLRNLEHECVELLGQANLSLQEISSKQSLDFKGYEKATEDAELWYQYQQMLLRVIKEISDLTYALNLGAISRENSNALCVPYMKQSEDSLTKLKGWHEEHMERLEVNLEEGKRKRKGVKGFLMKPLTIFNKDLDYKEVSRGTIQRIEHQSGLSSNETVLESEPYKEDVTLVAKEGKYYYLPNKK